MRARARLLSMNPFSVASLIGPDERCRIPPSRTRKKFCIIVKQDYILGVGRMQVSRAVVTVGSATAAAVPTGPPGRQTPNREIALDLEHA
ncbi:hypothetical protein GCM10010406_34740 [Streptomyces thermolineatus]|uniref:Uncharacterized protein n=1 Tax=Streptomyces thermolineatus TaxID=44033 RepID=A0ABN3M4E2_9ACTN